MIGREGERLHGVDAYGSGKALGNSPWFVRSSLHEDLCAGTWIIAGSILVFIPSLGAYVTPRVLGGGKNLMLGNLIELQFGAGRNWPLGAALSFILLLIVVVIMLASARLLMPQEK